MLSSLFIALVFFSALSLVAMLLLGARMVARLPPDYFTNSDRRHHEIHWAGYPPFLQRLLPILLNMSGLVLIVLGIVFLITPGQGLLTILAGLLMMNFPGKYRCERWLVSHPHVRDSINWLRSRRGEPPLKLD